jgi:hypothetical protein
MDLFLIRARVEGLCSFFFPPEKLCVRGSDADLFSGEVLNKKGKM